MEIQISSMTKEDLNCILPIWEKDFDKFWNVSLLISEFKNPDSLCFVAKYEKQIVGFASLWKSVDDIHITNIVTKSFFRRQGIGSQLLEFLIDTAKKLHFNSITLEVNENNSEAINLYRNHKFQELGLRKNYYHNAETAIIMTLFLS